MQFYWKDNKDQVPLGCCVAHILAHLGTSYTSGVVTFLRKETLIHGPPLK